MTAIDTNSAPRHAAAANVWPDRQRLGRILTLGSFAVLAATLAVQTLYAFGAVQVGFETWRPVVYAYVLWGAALCVGLALARGEAGQRALFVLPAFLYTVAVVIFPTVFALFVAFTDWNLSGATGPRFNGLDNFYQMLGEGYFWNALANMVLYVAAVFVQYALAFGLALLLNAEIRGRRFFRVAFL